MRKVVTTAGELFLKDLHQVISDQEKVTERMKTLARLVETGEVQIRQKWYPNASHLNKYFRKPEFMTEDE